MALATKYEVSTQVTASTVAERLPAMCGSDTFTTVVSSTSMKVQNITEMAMIQGLTCLCSGIGAEADEMPREHLQDTAAITVKWLHERTSPEKTFRHPASEFVRGALRYHLV